MRIDETFDRLWVVHADGSLAGRYTSRREARDRRTELKNAHTDVRISYSTITVGPITPSH